MDEPVRIDERKPTPWWLRKREKKKLKKAASAPAWIFVFAEDVLPGIFTIQPLDPTPDVLMKVDPEGTVLETALFSFLTSLSICANSPPLSSDEAVRRLSAVASKRMRRDLGAHEKVWVLPMKEVQDRAARGEFDIHEPTQSDATRWREYWAPIQTRVYNDLYTGKKRLPVPIVLPRRTGTMEGL